MNIFNSSFINDNCGSIAPIFAIALLPIVISAGAAMDYSRMAKDSATMQNAIDSAVLAGGSETLILSKGKIKKKVLDFLKANLEPRLYAQIGKLKIKVKKSEKTLTATIKGSTPTTILGILGKKEIKYNISASTIAAASSMEVVLVLDNTFSMSVDNKLVDLKSAANNFVTKLMETNKYENLVKVGIVPFSQYVNVGLDNRKASWMDVDDDSSKTVNSCLMTRKTLSTYGCRRVTNYNDGIPYTSQQCKHTYGPPYQVCGPSTTTYTWNGCVGSRNKPLNLQDAKPHKLFPGLMNQSCPSRLTELTYAKSKLTTQISAMVATGETYIPTGLMWGLRVISSQQPFNQGVGYKKATKKDVKKVIVLMTDGENQRSAQLPGAATHWGSDLSQANKWTTTACNEIKDKKISVYSVTFGPSLPKKAKKLIQNCATTKSQYFHAASGKDLNDAFEDILADLNRLRLTH